MKRNLLWMALMGIGFFSYGQGCARKAAHEELLLIDGKSSNQKIFADLLVFSSFSNGNESCLMWRGSTCSSFSNYSVRNYFTTYSIQSSIKVNLEMDADHGELSIKGCRPETIAYFIDGVRIRVGSIHIL